ncbi:MAG: lipid-A-disaccharide synthase [Pseudomonadales bacterium]
MIPAEPVHYVMVAGEPSGDALGAALIEAIKRVQPNAVCCGIGGPKMCEAGFKPWFGIEVLSVNGFFEPLLKLPTLIHLLFSVRRRARALGPAAFVGIDFNFFNLLLARQIKALGIPTVHYVSPTVWAWRSGRIRSIKARVDLMLTLYPFETEIYRAHGVPVRFVGHPKARAIGLEGHAERDRAARVSLGIPETDQVVSLLPGSRRSEVASMMPAYLDAVKELLVIKPALSFVIPAATPERGIEIRAAVTAAGLDHKIQIHDGEPLKVMAASDVVLVNSGTATLEAMLLRKPMVMAYRLSPMTYQIVSRLVTVSQFALPNILSERKLVREFIQDDVTGKNLANALDQLLSDQSSEHLTDEYHRLHTLLQADLSTEAALPIIALAQGRLQP